MNATSVNIKANSGNINLIAPGGNVYSYLGSSVVKQPVIQFGYLGLTSTTGSCNISIPNAYPTINYAVFLTLNNLVTDGVLYGTANALINSESTFTILYDTGGSYDLGVWWQTLGFANGE
jgi:hypothetical protein